MILFLFGVKKRFRRSGRRADVCTFLLVFALFGLPAAVAAADSPLSLRQCLERGMTHNPQILAYGLAVDEAGQAINEARGAFLPTLALSYGKNQLSGGNSNDRDSDYLDQSSDNFTIRLTQPLFAGLSGVAGLKRAHHSKEYRGYELRHLRQQLAREIRTSYYDWLHAERRAEEWQASVDRLEQQKEITAAWVGQQLAPRLRLLEVEVELSNARHELIRARSEEEIAAARLREWLAVDAGEPLDIVGDLEDEAIDPCANLDLCLEQALAQRPELRLAELNIDLARQDAKIILARNLPQARIDADWVDYQRDYDDRRYADDERDYYSVSLNLSIQPFQGGRNISAWRRQRIAVERYRKQLDQQRNAIVSDVRTRYQEMGESRARIDNAQATIAEARSAYQLASRSAELGVVSLADLLDAELRLTRAELNLIDSRYALRQAQARMLFALGGE